MQNKEEKVTNLQQIIEERGKFSEDKVEKYGRKLMVSLQQQHS